VRLSLEASDLKSYLRTQLRFHFPVAENAFAGFDEVVDEALRRLATCFRDVVLPGYRKNGEPFFNHLHADQNASFYYFCANSAYRMGLLELASLFFLFNKMQNGLVCMYDTALPDVFLLIHTVGTVLGKASYGSNFVAYQNVTVGTESGRQPAIGDGVVIYGGSMILGGTSLGSGSVVSANSTVIDDSVPADHIAIGRSPQLLIKARRRDFMQQYWEPVSR